MTLLTIPTLSAAALGLILAVFVRRALSDRDIPGPVLARYTRLWYMWQMMKGDFQYTNIRLHQDHGEDSIDCSLEVGIWLISFRQDCANRSRVV